MYNCRDCDYAGNVTPSVWCNHPLSDALPERKRNVTRYFMLSMVSPLCPLRHPDVTVLSAYIDTGMNLGQERSDVHVRRYYIIRGGVRNNNIICKKLQDGTGR